jgi:hypothetical protein
VETTEIAITQAELIVQLYELRREPVMRLARGYVLCAAGLWLLGYGGCDGVSRRAD